MLFSGMNIVDLIIYYDYFERDALQNEFIIIPREGGGKSERAEPFATA